METDAPNFMVVRGKDHHVVLRCKVAVRTDGYGGKIWRWEQETKLPKRSDLLACLDIKATFTAQENSELFLFGSML